MADLTSLRQLLAAKDARIAELETRVKRWVAETVKLNQQHAAKDKLIAAKDARIDGYIGQLKELRSSRSYRLGRAMTWPFRKFRQLLQGGR